MTKVVLLLEDSDQFRADLGKRLRASYAVHSANSIEHAQQIVLARRIDYAVIDLKLDYQVTYSGVAFVEFLKRRQPWTKVLVCSGYLSDEIKSKLSDDVDAFVSKGDPNENCILSVLRRLQELDASIRRKTCLAIMPMSDSTSCLAKEWNEVYWQMIEPAVIQSPLEYTCTRSVVKLGNIIEEVLDSLNKADLVIADLTDRNPNVFYEIGVRHALRDRTILIAQTLEDVPFDLRQYSILVYDWRVKEGRERFKHALHELMNILESDPSKGVSPVRSYLGYNGDSVSVRSGSSELPI